MKPRKEYLSIKELAAELDMSYSWCDKSARKGLIRFVWIGRRRKVPAAEVRRIKTEGIEGPVCRCYVIRTTITTILGYKKWT